MNDVHSAMEILVSAARIAHTAPEAPATEFRFGVRADGSGVDCFRAWQGVTLPFTTEPKKEPAA